MIARYPLPAITLDVGHKFRVTPEQSKAIQTRIFKLGGFWEYNGQRVSYTNETMLYVTPFLMLEYGFSEEFFNNRDFVLVSPDVFIKFLDDEIARLKLSQ